MLMLECGGLKLAAFCCGFVFLKAENERQSQTLLKKLCEDVELVAERTRVT